MLSCKHTSRLISEAQERKLSLKERISLRLHIWMCNSCRRFEKQIHFMRNIMSQEYTQDTHTSNETLPDDAQERIRQTLKAEVNEKKTD